MRALEQGEAQEPATPTWLEIRSPHFTVFTDGTGQQGRDIAAHFEQIRAVFQAAMPGSRVDPAAPMRILAVRNEGEFSRLLPEYWSSSSTMHPAGYFSGGEESNYVALRLDVAAQSDYLILYHEYIHLLENLNFTGLPLWLSEGLADYYGSVRPIGDKVGIGYPLDQHIHLLATGQRMPLTELLSTTETSADYIQAGVSTIFYAESWALTDFLMSGDHGARRASAQHYLSLVSHGTGSVDAARQSFGDLDRLSDDLFAFLAKGHLSYYTIPAPFAPGAKDMSTQTITAAEADAVEGDFMVFRGHAQDGRPLLEEAIRHEPSLAAPYASMGILYLRAGNHAEALRWFDQAAARHTDDYLAWYYRALLSLRQRPGPGVDRQAEADLERCLRLNSNFGEGYRALADLKSLLNQDAQQAVSLARRAIELDPRSAENHLTLGVIYLRMKDTAKAEAEGQSALTLATNPAQKGGAGRFLEVVSQTQKALSSGAAVRINAPAITIDGQPAEGTAPAPPPASPGAVSGTMTDQPAPPSAGTGPEATGTVEQVRCRKKTLTFVLVTTNGPLNFLSSDYTTLLYETTTPFSGTFSPCTQLTGRRITVDFQPGESKAGARELTRILLLP